MGGVIGNGLGWFGIWMIICESGSVDLRLGNIILGSW